LDSKSLEETTRYAKAFWARYEELPDWERTIANIAKGEQRLEQTTLKDAALAWKVEGAQQPWFDLDLTPGAWTKDEDNFLVCRNMDLFFLFVLSPFLI
jgi:SWI/SNF-related matrix-associated actin-dependent regulator of chromatin subfamily A member 5